MVGYYYQKPMLVSNVGGLAEIVPNEKCGYVLENSAPVIAEKIVDYFSNNREEKFTKNVINEKKKYEWQEFVNTLVTLYNMC